MSVDEQGVPLQTQELEELRAEVVRLRQQLQVSEAQAAQPPRPPSRSARGRPWRWLAAGIILLVVAILAPLAVVATWVHDEISDTDRYVQTVTPLASDPAVQDAVTARATDEIVARLNVEAVTKQAVDALAARGLPPRAAATLTALSTPLASGVHSFIENAVGTIVRSQQFQEAWVAANRVAHAQMVTVLTGKQGGAVEVSGNTVSLNLAPVVAEVKSRLQAEGFTLASRIPEVQTQLPIMQSEDITKAQRAFRLLGALARALPIIALLLLGLAVVVAPARRTALVIGAGVVAGSMVLLGALLNAFRAVYLDSVPTDQVPYDAAAAVYDTLIGFMRLSLRAVLVLFLAVAVIAWVTGPWSPAVAVRGATNRVVRAVRHGSDRAGLDTGAFGVALYRMRTPIRAAVLGVALLIYVMAAHPTGAFALVLLAVALLILLLVELLARPPVPAGEEAAADTRSVPLG